MEAIVLLMFTLNKSSLIIKDLQTPVPATNQNIFCALVQSNSVLIWVKSIDSMQLFRHRKN